MIFKNENQRQEAVRITKQLFDEGKTSKEVASMMCLSESTVRSLKKTIDIYEETNG